MQRAPRAFTINPLSLLLIVVLIALVIWKLTYIFNNIPPGFRLMPGAQSKLITTHVVIVIVSIALAGGVGAACYFIFARNQTAANAGILLTLCLPVATFGYQALNNIFNPHGPSAPLVPSSIADPSRPGSPPFPAPPLAPRIPDPAAHPAPITDWTDATIPIRDSFAADLDAAAASVIAKFNEVASTVSSTPPMSRESLKTRLTQIEAARQASSDLRDRLRNVHADLEKRLADSGLDHNSAFSLATKYASDSHSTHRAAACDECNRFFDAATEQTNLLRDNIGKWTAQGGTITSSDRSLDFKFRAVAGRLQMHLNRREQIPTQLQGK